jgi:hypothetical protein
MNTYPCLYRRPKIQHFGLHDGDVHLSLETTSPQITRAWYYLDRVTIHHSASVTSVECCAEHPQHNLTETLLHFCTTIGYRSRRWRNKSARSRICSEVFAGSSMALIILSFRQLFEDSERTNGSTNARLFLWSFTILWKARFVPAGSISLRQTSEKCSITYRYHFCYFFPR